LVHVRESDEKRRQKKKEIREKKIYIDIMR
jgi:hypothetical protein